MLIVLLLSHELIAMALAFTDCSTRGNNATAVKGFYGWPITLKCIDDVEDFYDYVGSDSYDYAEYYEVSQLECYIKDLENDRFLLNATLNISLYDFDDNSKPFEYLVQTVTESTPSRFEIVIKRNERCVINHVTLQKLPLIEESCEENRNRIAQYNTRVDLDQFSNFGCRVPEDDLTRPQHLIPTDQYDSYGVKVRWIHNCRSELSDRSTSSGETKLTINKMKYVDHTGTLTCAIEYNGMTRFIAHYDVCIKPPTLETLSVKCNDANANPGGSVTIKCNVEIGVGVSDIGIWMLAWSLSKRNDSVLGPFICSDSEINNDTKSRGSCEFNRLKHEVSPTTCFYTAPTDEQLSALRTKFAFVYKIRNVQDFDFGAYEFTIWKLDRNESITADKFELRKDSEQRPLRTQQILVIIFLASAGAALFFLLLWKSLGIEITFHKYCKPITGEKKRYGAYLAYYYDKYMKSTDSSVMEDFVGQLHGHLREMGFAVFDTCKNTVADQCISESLTCTLKDCHRVIIILTPEYVKDCWGVHEVYQAWRTEIQNVRVRMIFIILPETMSVIRDLPRDLQTALRQAIKRHNVIKWNGAVPIVRRLWMELDISMPKIASSGGKDIDEAHKSGNEIDTCRNDRCVYVQLKPVSTTETNTNQI